MRNEFFYEADLRCINVKLLLPRVVGVFRQFELYEGGGENIFFQAD